MNICLATTVIPTFYSVIKKPVNSIPIVLIILRSVNSSLSSNAMSSSRAVMIGKCFHLITEFTKSRRRRSTRKTCSNNYYFKLSLISRIHQFHIKLMARPFLFNGSFWSSRIKFPDHSFASSASTAVRPQGASQLS